MKIIHLETNEDKVVRLEKELALEKVMSEILIEKKDKRIDQKNENIKEKASLLLTWRICAASLVGIVLLCLVLVKIQRDEIRHLKSYLDNLYPKATIIMQQSDKIKAAYNEQNLFHGLKNDRERKERAEYLKDLRVK